MLPNYPRFEPTQRNSRAIRSMVPGTLGGNVMSARPYKPNRLLNFESAPSLPLYAWYQPSDLPEGLDPGDPVTGWPDSSGNGYDLDEYRTSQTWPKYATVAGFGAVEIGAESGARGTLTVGASHGRAVVDPGHTVALVCEVGDNGWWSNTLWTVGGTAGGDFMAVYVNNDSDGGGAFMQFQMFYEIGGVGHWLYGPNMGYWANNPPAFGPHLVVASVGAEGGKLYVDGTLVDSDATPFVTADPLDFHYLGDGREQVLIPEIRAWPFQLSDAQIASETAWASTYL